MKGKVVPASGAIPRLPETPPKAGCWSFGPCSWQAHRYGDYACMYSGPSPIPGRPTGMGDYACMYSGLGLSRELLDLMYGMHHAKYQLLLAKQEGGGCWWQL